jgi:hypothetical protein
MGECGDAQEGESNRRQQVSAFGGKACRIRKMRKKVDFQTHVVNAWIDI